MSHILLEVTVNGKLQGNIFSSLEVAVNGKLQGYIFSSLEVASEWQITRQHFLILSAITLFLVAFNADSYSSPTI
jgi:hypothetical protein